MTTDSQKRYSSAGQRFLGSALNRFLKQNIPSLGGNELRSIVVEKILELFDSFTLKTESIKPGQMLWVAVDKNTRPDSKQVKFKPVVLTITNQEDVKALTNGLERPFTLLPSAIARITKEAYQQGALMSMRDLGLIFHRKDSDLVRFRRNWEKEHNEILPMIGPLQDMGSAITHKAFILRKILIEKKDMPKVREESQHTQQAIDRYLKDYRRVELLLNDGKSHMYISQATGMPVYLIKQYEDIYMEVKNDLQKSA